MKIRYIPADPAGNLTGFVLTPVPKEQRARIAVALMARCAEGFEQIGFIDPKSLMSGMPRMDMMGGEFCGNATRSFALLCAQLRGMEAGESIVSVSGAEKPVRVRFDLRANEAYADVPLPVALERIVSGGRDIPVVRMEGIAHAIVRGEAPSQALAQQVLAAMPPEDAQGVIFLEENRLTPAVYVRATGALVWESSCGSGSVAAAWLLARGLPDGGHGYSFAEPGGTLNVSIQMENGQAVRAVMGGAVTLGEEKEIQI